MKIRKLATVAAAASLAAAGLTVSAPADTASAICRSPITVLNQGAGRTLTFRYGTSYLAQGARASLCNVGTQVKVPRKTKLIVLCTNMQANYSPGSGGVILSHWITWYHSDCGPIAGLNFVPNK